MERLYEAKEPNVEGLPNPDQVLEKIRLVGDTASREGADLLESCAPGIEERFLPISAIQRVRTNLEKIWDLKFRVAPKETTNQQFEIGVCIAGNPGDLIPYVWCRGGRRAADDVVRVLGHGTRVPVEGWHSGSVGLAKIKIPIPARLEEPVACSPLVAQVHQVFASFTVQHVVAIAATASKRGEA
jgi:hypothetical protein